MYNLHSLIIFGCIHLSQSIFNFKNVKNCYTFDYLKKKMYMKLLYTNSCAFAYKRRLRI